ncbi:hypothetical protein [Thalassomonas haliotis]|uniref:Uncharacterized protein n=1 Tax=Thalassomonas haliotis TaxID=485448 RepID=A0ABY7VFH0_9GAMM|nr:hypothetical protein [Thalassomonas haliotis]WDE12434.1 hypothetical protein H3N35_02815 [Thalassomonas haliotis]
MKFPTIESISFRSRPHFEFSGTNQAQTPDMRIYSIYQDTLPGDVFNLERVNEKEETPLQIDTAAFVNKLFSPQQQPSFNLRIANLAADTVLQRLSSEQQAALNKNKDLLLDNDFITLASKLNNQELEQLVTVADVLFTTPSDRHQATSVATGDSSIKTFTETLATLNDEDRALVLAQASAFAAKVPPSDNNTYDAGGKSSGTNNSFANNNLHNFVLAINNTEDARGLITDLAGFEEEQQANLLNVLSVSDSLGNELMNQLAGLEEKDQLLLLDYLGDIAQKIKPQQKRLDLHALPLDPYMSLSEASQSDSSRRGMLEDSIKLLSRYQFDENQLAETFTQIKTMRESDQQAYLKITTVSLEHLLGVPEGEAGSVSGKDKIALKEQTRVLDTIEMLRSDEQIRELTAKSALGNKVMNEEKQKLYTVKDQASAGKDQQTMIKLLTSDAWIRKQNDSNKDSAKESNALANLFLQQRARDRDALAEKITGYSTDNTPLSKLSQQELNKNYADVYARTSVLAHTKEPGNLLIAEQHWDASEEINNAFWQMASLAGDRVDEFQLSTVKLPGLISNQVYQHFANRADSVVNGEYDRSLAEQEISEFIDFVTNERDQDKKQAYINDMTGQDMPLYWKKLNEHAYKDPEYARQIIDEAREVFLAHDG